MINFMKYRLIYFIISALFLFPSGYFLTRFGLNLSLDFTGGTLLEVQIQPDSTTSVSTQQLRQMLEQSVTISSIQLTGPNAFLIRTQALTQVESKQLQEKIESQFGTTTEKRFETIGPTLGKELIRKTITGVILATAFILFYVAYSFKDKKYGVCAILAMFHDSFILLGIFSFLGVYYDVEVDALFVTALLTILSFSVHDTVVVYDRIRETSKHHDKLSFVDIVNRATTETITRSVNNSLTIIFMLLALYLLGGETIKWFVFAFLTGTILGTYSSTFVAVPLLVVWDKISSKKLSHLSLHL